MVPHLPHMLTVAIVLIHMMLRLGGPPLLSLYAVGWVDSKSIPGAKHESPE